MRWIISEELLRKKGISYRHINTPIKPPKNSLESMNNEETRAYHRLKILEGKKLISDILYQPSFTLHCRNGNPVCIFTPDFSFYNTILKKKTVWEVKATKKQWSYKRRDYPLRKKWFCLEYPDILFFEVINGEISKPIFKKTIKNKD